MSRTLDLLQAAEERKTGKYTSVISKSECVFPEEVPEKPQEIKLNKSIFIVMLFVCCLSFLSVLYLRFSMMGELNKTKVLLAAKIDNIGLAIEDSHGLVAGVQNRAIKNEKEMQAIQGTLDAQKSAIENLVKAKNNIFSRVTELEALKGEIVQ